MNNINKFLAHVLVVALVFGQFSTVGYGAEASTQKDEIVYGMLLADGSVDHIYVVNSFSNQDKIVDYGDYSKVRNMTTTDELSVNGDEITTSTDAQKLYYQGDLSTTDLPWNISIHYYMDNQEYSPEDIAGLSGKLKITMDITQNTACDESFWKGYSLQIKATLDSYMVDNLQSEGATIADVGSDKQLSYIVLPGKEKQIEIDADVTDFEMEAITINGIRLNLNVDYDGLELTSKITELQNAGIALDDGVDELNEGTSDLYDGTKQLSDGASELNDGVQSLNVGIKKMKNALAVLDGKSDKLTDGSAEMVKALAAIKSSLDDVSLDTTKLTTLSTSSTRIKNGINSLVSGLQTMDGSIASYNAALKSAGISDVSDFAEKNSSASAALSQLQSQTTNPQTAAILGQAAALLNADSSYVLGSSQLINGIDNSLDQDGELMSGALSLKSNYEKFDSNIQSMATSLSSISTKMVSLKAAIDKLNKKYKKLDAGIDEYTKAVAKINSGYKKIYTGVASTAIGTKKLYNSTKKLVNGTGELLDGTEELKEGTGEFVSKTSNLDTDVTDMIDDTINDLTGSSEPVVSFVSNKNTNVDSVLFVMKTQAIAIPEEESVEAAQTEEKSFFQKLIALFKVDK